MTAIAERIREELAGLSLEERAEMAGFLIQSLDAETGKDDAAWEMELERRAEEIRSGKEPGISGDEVFAELSAKHR
jgi:putative addiction module component (TIGR02574 family)